MERSEVLSRVRAHCTRVGSAVLLDEPGGLFFDVPSGKSLPLNLAELERAEERRDKQTGRPYLLVVYGDGRQLALSDAGIAFAPDFRNSGPIGELPQAVCLADFRTLLDRVKHELYGHPDRPPGRDAVKVVMMCIAILDGARAVGFDVGREEQELEHHLAELERRSAR